MFIPLDYTSICFWKQCLKSASLKRLYWTGVIWGLLTKSQSWGYPIRWPGSSKEWQCCLPCFPVPCGMNWLQRPQLLFNLSKYDSLHANPPPNKRQKENKFGGPKSILERKSTLLKISLRWGLHSMGRGDLKSVDMLLPSKVGSVLDAQGLSFIMFHPSLPGPWRVIGLVSVNRDRLWHLSCSGKALLFLEVK